MEFDPFRRSVAEFVGTFTLVFIGGTAAVVGAGGLVGVAFAFGLSIAVMVSAVGHISGGHFNPAITIGFAITRRIDLTLGGIYILAQLAAATLAAVTIRVVFPDNANTSGDVPQLARVLTSGQGVLLEAILTFFLVWVVFATAVDPRGTFKSIAGLAIGFTITLDILAGGPLTGAAMNPARAFGPQVVENFWTNGWIYYVGPIVGGAVAALAYEWLYLRPLAPIPVGPPETGVLEPRPGDTAAS
jgi:aquaporin TIP